LLRLLLAMILQIRGSRYLGFRELKGLCSRYENYTRCRPCLYSLGLLHAEDRKHRNELLTTVYTMLTQFLSEVIDFRASPVPCYEYRTRYPYSSPPSTSIPKSKTTRSYASFSTCLLYYPIYYPSIACQSAFIYVCHSRIQMSEPSGICQYNTTRR